MDGTKSNLHKNFESFGHRSSECGAQIPLFRDRHDLSLKVRRGQAGTLPCDLKMLKTSSQHEKASNPEFLTYLKVPAECVDQLHLTWGLTIRFENLGRRDQNSQTLRPRNRNIEAVPAVEKFHASRRICMT